MGVGLLKYLNWEPRGKVQEEVIPKPVAKADLTSSVKAEQINPEKQQRSLANMVRVARAKKNLKKHGHI